MSDLKKYIASRKKRDKAFAEGFEEGYEQFKIAVGAATSGPPGSGKGRTVSGK